MSAWRDLFSARIVACVGLGFASGLPLYTTTQLVPAWLTAQGVDLTSIGLFALAGTPYAWKFLWAPLLDRALPANLDRRRTWAAILQGVLLLGLAGFAWLEPSIWASDLMRAGVLTVLVSFASASQDIVVDAWRRELLTDRELGHGTAWFANAYRVSQLVPGGLALILADHAPWSTVFAVTAGFMALGLLTTWLAPEPVEHVAPPPGLRDAVVLPLQHFLTARGWSGSAAFLAFLVLFKLGDAFATSMVTPFYLSIGFTPTEIGTVAKVVGLWSTVAGATVGGALMTRIGIHRALWLFGAVQAVSVLAFSALAAAGPSLLGLSLAVAAEYLGVGLGNAAFLAFVASRTDRAYAATQYALFSGVAALPRTLFAASAGWLVQAVDNDWTLYFALCSMLALPGLAMVPLVAPWPTTNADEPQDATPRARVTAPSMTPTRRAFLQTSALGAAALTVGGLGVGLRPGRVVEPSRPLRALTPRAFSVIAAVAERVNPGGPSLAGRPDFPAAGRLGVAEAVDDLLATCPPGMVAEVEQACTLFENPLTNLLVAGTPTAFTAMDAVAQDRVLEGWRTSPIGLRRQVYKALRTLTASAYYARPEVWPALGYAGPLAAAIVTPAAQTAAPAQGSPP
ncbi:MAG: AmpG [Pseudomonadota bacterium]|jgi:PAT family beta-lactamase induction signal transducer AmpG